MYKIEKTIKNGKLTRYEDVELPELICPCCSEPMKYYESSLQNQKLLSFHCIDCDLKFEGMEDLYRYIDFEDFYNFVKSRIELKK